MLERPPEPGAPPGRIDVKTGFSCNNRCTFCVQGDKRFEYGDKSTEAVKAILEEGVRGADAVVFTGGEVTIRKDLPELVAHARQLGFRTIQLQTNGRMLSSMKFLRRLVEAGITEVSPAIHGPTAPVHDRQTQVPGSFRQTVKGVLNARQLGLPVIMNSVITQQNVALLPDTARLFVSLGVAQFQFAFVHALGTAGRDIAQVMPRFSDAQWPMLRAMAIGRKAGIPCMVEAVPLCFLPGYEAYAAEWIIPRTKIFDATWVVEDYTALRTDEGKCKGSVCRGCAYERTCEGPWREYPEHYGWDEFVPVVAGPAQDP